MCMKNSLHIQYLDSTNMVIFFKGVWLNLCLYQDVEFSKKKKKTNTQVDDIKQSIMSIAMMILITSDGPIQSKFSLLINEVANGNVLYFLRYLIWKWVLV